MAEEPNHPQDPDRVLPRHWLGLARAVPSAFDARKLAVAALGLLLLQAGWWAVGRLAPAHAPVRPGPGVLDFASLYGSPFASPADLVESLRRPAWNLTAPWRVLVEPLRQVFAIDGGSWDFLPGSLARLAWAVFAMGLAGGAACRLAAVEAAGGRETLADALRFAARHAWDLFAAPLYPLAIVLGLGLVSTPFGLVARVVPSAATAAFAVPVVLGVASAILLILMVATWPLVHAAVAAESEVAIEAIGRTYGYARHRAMTLAGCLAFAWALGTLGLAAFEVFLWAAAHLAVWGAGLAAYPAPPGSLGGAFEPWAAAIGLACRAWAFAYFWSAAVRVHRILRQDLDAAPGPAPAIGIEAGGSAAAR